MNEVTEKLAAAANTTQEPSASPGAIGNAAGYVSSYPYTKADMAAATRLQIWQEIMRHGDSGTDPVAAATAAASIFDKLYAG